jgi:hypothetical protein
MGLVISITRSTGFRLVLLCMIGDLGVVVG